MLDFSPESWTTCLLGLSLALAFLGYGKLGIGLAILAVCGNVAFFSVGIGPICGVLSSEIFPLRLRAQASALGAVRAITVAGTFFIFSVLSALSVAFVHTCVPETKGKSLEEIEMIFHHEGDWQGNEVELGDVQRLMQKHVEVLFTRKCLQPKEHKKVCSCAGT